MAYLDGNVTDQNEVPVEGALVYVYSGGSLADLEDSLGQPIQNPVTTGEDGYWRAYVADGYYTARYFWGGRQRYVEANVLAGAPPVGPNSDPNVRFDLNSTDADKGGSMVVLTSGGNLNQAIRYVTPEMFEGSIQAAAAYASANNRTLLTGPVDYELTTAFEPANLTWISDNTRIKQTTTSAISCLKPGSNVKILGRVYLWLADAVSGTANRAHVLCGSWETGVGIENFHFDEFVLEGGHVNCNGFSVAGDSHNIRGRRIDAGTSTRIGRAFMAHWGNFNEHYNSGGTYQHAGGAGPTTHPHDIVIDEVVGDLELSDGDFCALWAVSAGYDIHVGRVKGRCVNNGAGPGNLVLFTAGDLGLAYASADELAAGMWGLTIGQVTGYSSEQAVNRIGRALYFDADSTPQDAADYFANIQEAVGLVDAECTTGSNSHCCVDGHNGRGSSSYGKINSKLYRSASNCSNYTREFKAGEIEAIDCQNHGIQLQGAGTDEADWPTDVSIGTVRVNGTGLSEATAGNAVAFQANKIIGLHIGKVVIDKLKDMSFAAGSIAIGGDVRGVTITDVQQNWVAPSGQTACVTNAAGADRFVDIGHIRAPAGLVPVSGGATSRVIGRNREYHYFGGTPPSGLTVKVGDRFVANTTNAGQAFIYVVTTAGVTGTDAVVEPAGQARVATSVASAPSFVGQFAVASGVGYISTGTSSSGDWKQITA